MSLKEHDESSRNPGAFPVRKEKEQPKKPLPKNAGDALKLDWNENAQSSAIVTK